MVTLSGRRGLGGGIGQGTEDSDYKSARGDQSIV